MAQSHPSLGLSYNEHVVWRQRAAPWGLAARKAPGLLFSLCWAGFSWSLLGLFLFAQATPDPAAPPLWPAFIVLGMFSVFGLIFVYATGADMLASWSTHYVLTNKRILIVSGNATQSFDRSAFAMATVRGSQARGHIEFAWGPMGRRSVGYTACLVGIRDPHAVLDLIRETLGAPD